MAFSNMSNFSHGPDQHLYSVLCPHDADIADEILFEGHQCLVGGCSLELGSFRVTLDHGYIVGVHPAPHNRNVAEYLIGRNAGIGEAKGESLK